MFLIEVVTDRYLVVEQGNILLQSLLVEFLLVERPTELIESEFVELGGEAQADDARIGVLGVAVASAREEVLARLNCTSSKCAECGFVRIRRSIVSMASSVRPSSSYARDI